LSVVPSDVRLRGATSADLGRIREIYNHSIQHETASMHTEPRTDAQMREWFAGRGERYPVIVAGEPAEGAERVVGWASLSRWDERKGYDPTVEFTFYVDPAARGRGVGKRLLAYLIEVAPQLGARCIVSRITGESAASVRAHESLGFTHAGTLRQMAQKFGRTHDILLYQRHFGDSTDSP
jgi:phosphinothricin acetyltransferase